MPDNPSEAIERCFCDVAESYETSEAAIEVPLPFAAPLIDALQAIASRGGIVELEDDTGSAYGNGMDIALGDGRGRPQGARR